MSRTYRWGGHSCWDLPLSVAQHSLLVMVLRQKLRPLEPLTRSDALRELLSDADEGLLSYDPISPVKPHLGADFRALAGRMQAAVQTRYGLQPWDDESYVIHKQADRLAAASEAMHVAGWAAAELHETLEIGIPPLTADPLPAPDGMRPWEPWPARVATALFLAKLQELTAPGSRIDPADPTDLTGAIVRVRTVTELAAAFTRLPSGRRLRWREGLRNRLMFALAYYGALRREELVGLRVSDFDVARRLVTIRAETSKGSRSRVVCYAPAVTPPLAVYLDRRRTLDMRPGPMFLSESDRNPRQPLTKWSWSKIVERLARQAGAKSFSTHTLRHLRLIHLARSGWRLHDIATYAGHRNLQTSTIYIHISGEDLLTKKAQSVDHLDARLGAAFLGSW